MAQEFRPGRGRDPIDRMAEKVDRKIAAIETKTRVKRAVADAKTQAKTQARHEVAAAKQAATAAARAAAHGHVVAHLDALDLWTRSEPDARRPRLGRAELAAAAIRVADSEGIDAVSMRRLAIELEVGTMSLYHYVRTKDELLALMIDELLLEVVVPGQLPRDWRQAMTAIARRSRQSLRRHPWVFDIVGDPTIGPNAVRHFDQSWQAVEGLDVDLTTKLDIITAVDEYTFGSCLMERQRFSGHDDPGMLRYIERLLDDGSYPALLALADEYGTDELWARIQAHAADEERFERNLARLLDGFDRGFARRPRG